MNSIYLSRYTNKKASALTIKKRSSSSSALQKLSYHTSRYQTLEPISDASTSAAKSKSMSMDEPIDDAGVPNTLTTVELVHQTHHKDIQLPDLGPLPQTINKSSFQLLEKKLNLCCTLCDFTDPDVDKKAKSVKSQTLKEIMNVFSNSTTIKSLPDSIIDQFFNMIQVNLNRGLPSIPKKYLVYDDEPSLVDIAWTHLSLVYQSLLKYQKINPKDKRFDHNFLNLMFSLLHAPDINERDSVLNFFTCYLETFPDRESNVMEILSNCLIGYRDKVYGPFCVIPSLNIFLTRFKLKTEIYQPHIDYFYNSILPLHISSHVFSYYDLITQAISFFVSLNSELSIVIFNKVMKTYPEARPSKQILFINLIIFIVERIPPDKFETIAVPLFSFLARTSQSCHYKVVNSSFQIWGNVTILPMILDNTKIIYPIVYPWFNKTMKEHWSTKTQNAALNTLKSMHDTDPFMFDELSQNQNNSGKNKSQQPPPPVDQGAAQLHKNWAMVARAAAKVDKNVNLARVLTEIQVKFNTNNSNDKNSGNKKKTSSTPNLGNQNSGPQILSPNVRRMF